MYDDELIRPWYDGLPIPLSEWSILDMHGHSGFNDPDTFTCSAEELIVNYEASNARGMVTPMHEPDGYPAANDRVLAEAEASGGRLIPFCRIDPNKEPLTEARRCFDAGARGIKLHPRAEGFDLVDSAVDDVVAFAHERRAPVLIHAGRGIPALAFQAMLLADKYPDARLILAHTGVTDLGWMCPELPRYPNLYVDSAWWNSTDLATLITHAPPGQILYGSDMPYMTPFLITTLLVRIGLQAGLTDEQLRLILGAQAERVIFGDDPLDGGAAPGPERLTMDVLLERLYIYLLIAVGRMLLGNSGYEYLAMARLACEVPEPGTKVGEVARHVLAILDRQERFQREHPDNGKPFYPGVRLIMIAAGLARTADVALPAIPELQTAEAVRSASMAGHRASDEADVQPAVDAPSDLRRSSAADLFGVTKT